MRRLARTLGPARRIPARSIIPIGAVVAGAFLACALLAGAAIALEPGDPAPAFDLLFLAEEGGLRAPECFLESPVTVLLIWDRGCPHCLDLALSSSALADSIEPLGARVLGIVLGPDDPAAIRDVLWERAVAVRQLWDRERKTAGAYDLGIKHIGIFVIDRSGTIRACFDDKVDDLVAAVRPAVMDVIDGSRSAGQPQPRSFLPKSENPVARSGIQPLGWPTLHFDGRSRLTTTDRARPGDVGLYGETIENGALLLHRWDLRLTWELTPRIVIEPWLRVGNESETALTEGAEQLSNPHGSLSVRYVDRSVSATLGAYPLRLSPLALQRWDLDDLPPIGGGAGGVSCACGGGALGLQQKSLEMLGTDYTFEGASASIRTDDWLARGWIAIPRHENRGSRYPSAERDQPRFRRIVYGGSLDLGRAGAVERTFGLPQPFGVRAGFLWLEDDKRTLDPSTVYLPYLPSERDERVGFVLASAGPWNGISADMEFAELRSNDPFDSHGRGFRGGLRGERAVDRLVFWGRAHRIQIDPGFAPYYRALTYEENREGWRSSLGFRLLPYSGAAREWLGLTLYSRDVRERSSSAGQGIKPPRWTTYGISVLGRPLRDLVIEAHWVAVREKRPLASGGDIRTSGASIETYWDGLGTLQPSFRLEAIRPESGIQEAVTIWQTYISVRALK